MDGFVLEGDSTTRIPPTPIPTDPMNTAPTIGTDFSSMVDVRSTGTTEVLQMAAGSLPSGSGSEASKACEKLPQAEPLPTAGSVASLAGTEVDSSAEAVNTHGAMVVTPSPNTASTVVGP